MEIPDYEPFYIGTPDALRAESTRLGFQLPISDDFAALLQPYVIGSKTIPNRFCAQPISGNDSDSNGAPSHLTHRRYQRYARGGFGLIWVESTAAVQPISAPRLWLCQETLGTFRKLVAGIREEAEKRWSHTPVIILQLSAQNDSPVHRFPLSAESAAILTDREVRPLSDATITAAALAAEAGFDGVDIQACHGALAGEFLSAFTREGDFGGSFENRSRFLRETISGIAAQNTGLLLASRLCAYDAIRRPFGFGVDADDYRTEDHHEPKRLVTDLHRAGLDLLNVTSASPNRQSPATERSLSPIADGAVPHEHPLTVLARQLRLAHTLREAAPDLPVIGSGFSWLRHFTPHVAAAAIAGGKIDFAGLGRGALAYPEAPADVSKNGAMRATSSCMVCFACTTLHGGGAEVGCPIRDPGTYAEPYQITQHLGRHHLHGQARRCHFCEAAPCVNACPTATDIPAFIRAYLDGDDNKAYQIIRKSDPLPELTSHLSAGWLAGEGACIETALTGKPVPILDLQYAIGWHAREQGRTGARIPDKPTGKKVTIVGAGLPGLAAAVRLLEYGHEIEILEAADHLGGTPARVIPSSRLPSTTPEIEALLAPALKAGRLRIQFKRALGEDVDLGALRANSDAILLATGVWKERTLGIAKGVVSGLAFLESVKRGTLTTVPPRVAVLAGGDSAMDAAFTAKNLGAIELFIVFGGPRSEMHWHLPESWFATPGVHALMLCEPFGYEIDSCGHLESIRIRHQEFGTENILHIDLAIEAIGLQPDQKPLGGAGIALAESGLVRVDPEYRTSLENTFAAGGIINGGASAAQCVAEGLAAAEAIHMDIS